MDAVALAIALVAYSNAINLWPPFNRGLYVPANTVAAAVVLWLGFGPLGLDAGAAGVSRPDVVRVAVAAAAATALMVPVLVAASSRRFAARIADARVAHLAGPSLAFQTLVRVPVGTALLEEVAFRGVLFGVLLSYGVTEAIVGSSLAFGLWHVSPTVNLVRANRPGASRRTLLSVVATGVIATTVAGVGLAWLRWIASGIAAPWIVHSVVNSLATVASVRAHRTEGSPSGDGAG